MKNQKISVIIPVYNRQRTLRQCLDSLLDQTYNNYELIVVDNNSTDKTKEMIHNFHKKDKRVKYLFEKIRARGAARNTGEKAAKGDIVLMTDSDCVVPINWIANMIRPILNKECDAVQGSEESINNSFLDKQIHSAVRQKMRHVRKNRKIIGNVDTKNFAIRMSSLESIGFTSRKYVSGNDTELSIRMQKNDLKLRFLPDVKVRHHHPTSWRTLIRKQFYRAGWCVKITKDHKDFLKKTSFLQDTNQTFWTFIKIFPGLVKTLVLKGPGKMYFDLVTGVSWRAGLIYRWMIS